MGMDVYVTSGMAPPGLEVPQSSHGKVYYHLIPKVWLAYSTARLFLFKFKYLTFFYLNLDDAHKTKFKALFHTTLWSSNWIMLIRLCLTKFICRL